MAQLIWEQMDLGLGSGHPGSSWGGQGHAVGTNVGFPKALLLTPKPLGDFG